MRTRNLVLALVIVLAAIALTSCTKKEYITNQPPADSVHISGTVYCWRCGIGDPMNNPFDPDLRRLSVNEGETAQITFIRDNGFTTTVETNDTAEYSLYLSAGSFNAVVATGFNYPPDTFYNINLSPGDTVLSFDVSYLVLDATDIYFRFVYPRIVDTLSTSEEWRIISDLNELTYYKNGIPALNLSGITAPSGLRHIDVSSYTHEVYVEYALPTNRKSDGHSIYHVVEARDLLQSVIDADTTGWVPENLSISIADKYACLF